MQELSQKGPGDALLFPPRLRWLCWVQKVCVVSMYWVRAVLDTPFLVFLALMLQYSSPGGHLLEPVCSGIWCSPSQAYSGEPAG